MLNWLKELFNHPKTTITGLGALAGAAVMGYGMSTGTVPIDSHNIAITGGLASAGLAGVFGKDAKPVKAIDAAVLVAPAVDLVQQFQNLKLEANTAQDKLNNFAAVTQALADALPPDTITK